MKRLHATTMMPMSSTSEGSITTADQNTSLLCSSVRKNMETGAPPDFDARGKQAAFFSKPVHRIQKKIFIAEHIHIVVGGESRVAHDDQHALRGA